MGGSDISTSFSAVVEGVVLTAVDDVPEKNDMMELITTSSCGDGGTAMSEEDGKTQRGFGPKLVQQLSDAGAEFNNIFYIFGLQFSMVPRYSNHCYGITVEEHD